MAKDYKVVNGVRFAKDVDTSDIDWEAPADPELVAELKRPGKIRITTMIDEDVYAALKEQAQKEGDGRYQTYLNQLLRDIFFTGIGQSPTTPFEFLRSVDWLQSQIDGLQAMVNTLKPKQNRKDRRTKRKAGAR